MLAITNEPRRSARTRAYTSRRRGPARGVLHRLRRVSGWAAKPGLGVPGVVRPADRDSWQATPMRPTRRELLAGMTGVVACGPPPERTFRPDRPSPPVVA